MTFREKLEKEHMMFVNDELFTGGCAACPRDYGYEDIEPEFCEDTDDACRKCWDREIER